MITCPITSTQKFFTKHRNQNPISCWSVNEWKCIIEEALIKQQCSGQWCHPKLTVLLFRPVANILKQQHFYLYEIDSIYKPSVLHIHTLHVPYMLVLRGFRLVLWARLRGHTVWCAVRTEAPHTTAPAIRHEQTQIVKVIWPLSHLPLGVVGFQEWWVHIALCT